MNIFYPYPSLNCLEDFGFVHITVDTFFLLYIIIISQSILFPPLDFGNVSLCKKGKDNITVDLLSKNSSWLLPIQFRCCLVYRCPCIAHESMTHVCRCPSSRPRPTQQTCRILVRDAERAAQNLHATQELFCFADSQQRYSLGIQQIHMSSPAGRCIAAAENKKCLTHGCGDAELWTLVNLA